MKRPKPPRRFVDWRTGSAAVLLGMAMTMVAAAAASTEPAPFAGAAGRWLKIGSLGRVWRPEVPKGWSPYRNGIWGKDDEGRPRWMADASWEREAAGRGRWGRAATWGWVWKESPAPDVRPAVAFVRIPGKPELYAWVPLGPHDDIRRLGQLEARGASPSEAHLDNLRPPFEVPARPIDGWPGGETRILRKLPKDARLVPPESLR